MGDLSEIRGMVLIFTFIATMAFLINLIPAQFNVAEYEGRTVNPATYFESLDLLYYAETVNITLDDSGVLRFGSYFYNIIIGGHNVEIIDDPEPELYMRHYWYWFIFPTAHHYLSYRFAGNGLSRGNEFSPTELDTDYTEGNIKYIAECDHFQMMVFFGFNETAYASPSVAWANNDLHILFAIEFDQTNTTINAWSLISMLLFFQIPTIHPLLNVFFTIPIWIALTYLVYITILRAIGALFGGGA